MLKVETKFEIGARFKFIKGTEESGVNFESDWMDNLVLDVGLDMLGAVGTSVFSYVLVGTGNSTPTTSQLKLDSAFAVTSINLDVTDTLDVQEDFITWKTTQRGRFNVGTFNNTNLTEVALNPLNNLTSNCFNRALIRDINGDPTVITVLSTEYLDVICELRCRQAVVEKTGNIDLGLSQHTYKIRPAGLSYITGTQGRVGTTIQPSNTLGGAGVFSGTLPVSLTAAPTGYISSGTRNKLAYVGGSHKLQINANFNLTQANGSIRSIGLHTYGVCTGSFIEFTPAIVKNNTQTLNILYEISWSRFT